MTVRVGTALVRVHDAEAAIGFYRDALGLETPNNVAAWGLRWVTVVASGQVTAAMPSSP
jgi:catechol 2,3-dioxygenase-like lactoylglutathione lyase family enzyme